MTVIHRWTLPLPPSANEYWVPAQGRGLVPSKKALEYKARVAGLLRDCLPIVGPVVCGMWLFLPKDNGDLSNRLKVLEDAVEGFLFLDDKQIRGYADLWRAVDPERPRVVYRVEGERFASMFEAQTHRLARAQTSSKRRATTKKNRAEKQLAEIQARIDAAIARQA